MERIKNESEYNLIDWWKKVFIDNYANFEGRARRSEYWYYVLGNLIIVFSLYFLMFVLGLALQSPIVFGFFAVILVCFGLASIIPGLAVIVRRLHDTSKSGWWFLISLVPFGGIVLLVFYCTEGDRGSNEYGPDPKKPHDNEINQIGR